MRFTRLLHPPTSTTAPAPLDFGVRIDYRARRIRLEGELDLATAHMVDDAIQSLTDEQTGDVAVDLDGLTFIDSVGLDRLHTARGRLQRSGFSLTLLHTRGPYARMAALASRVAPQY
jgi:anti-anti-sigma factor